MWPEKEISLSTLYAQYQNLHSPHSSPYISYCKSWENLSVHQDVLVLVIISFTLTTYTRTTRIDINQININPNDYYNPIIDYYNSVIDYYNPLLRFKLCLNQLGLILILCKININLINILIRVILLIII